MNKLLFIFMISGICLMSCNQQTGKQIGWDVVDFDNISSGEFEIQDVEYIPLETKENCLLGGINKIIYKNDKFYILDRGRNKGVYIFDKEGKFISSINKQGEGPGEYIEIMDMDVDNEDNVYIADNAKTDIIKYVQANPDNYETIHVGEHFMEFCYLDKQSFILRDVFSPEGQKMKLACFNHKKKSVTPLLQSKYENINEMDIMRCSKHYLYRSNEQIYYNERFTPAIYSISPKGELINHYKISSEHYISENGLKELEKKSC